ncbi:hypothetical protein Q5P01_023368 [Channa striata]|uniref:Uncharacterized protein n=1 Tax=Channa striata TaxID=64152 RepID=A0AA88ITE1_CHASR|nr:hypothetical protein Q5P01_023368 [Channa striata]
MSASRDGNNKGLSIVEVTADVSRVKNIQQSGSTQRGKSLKEVVIRKYVKIKNCLYLWSQLHPVTSWNKRNRVADQKLEIVSTLGSLRSPDSGLLPESPDPSPPAPLPSNLSTGAAAADPQSPGSSSHPQLQLNPCNQALISIKSQ